MASHVVVDGSNIATEGRSLPSLAQLDEAVQAFMAEHPSDRLTVVVDASFGHRIDASERKAYEDAIDANELITPPAGTTGRGDAFILEIAERAGATVLSNDSFQEFHGDHPWLFEDGRLIGGKPVPDVGWVFLPRTPVRGPASRRSTRDAEKAAKATSGGADSTSATDSGSSGASGSGRSRGRRGRGRGKGDGEPVVEQAPAKQAAKKASSPRPTKAEPLNDPLPFIEFVGAHPVGSTVTGEVERFTSHGAHVLVGGVRCYVDLAGLGDPAPTKARDVLDKDAQQDFLIVAVDTPRRGIDLALPGSIAAKEAGLTGGGKAPAEKATKKAGGRKEKAAPAEKATKKAGGRKKTAVSEPAAAKASAKKAGGRKKAAPEKAPAKKAAKRTRKAEGTRTRGAASAPLPPEPGDMSYGTIASPPPKKKGLLGRLTGRS